MSVLLHLLPLAAQVMFHGGPPQIERQPARRAHRGHTRKIAAAEEYVTALLPSCPGLETVCVYPTDVFGTAVHPDPLLVVKVQEGKPIAHAVLLTFDPDRH